METRLSLRIRLLLAGGILLVTILLLIVFRGAVREVVVEPLWDIIIGVQIFLSYIPQGLLWSLFLLAALYLAARSLTGRELPTRIRETEAQHPGQVGIWARRIRLLVKGDYSRWYFLQYIEKLVVNVLADQKRLTRREIRQRLKARELKVPPEVQDCIQAEMAPGGSRRFSDTILKFWQRMNPRSQKPSFDSDLESIVQFLEHQLEVTNDR
ncbi:MAG: hypothetical protein AB8I69_01060 [Anaerolineae bacterium]|jgi:hypothetical protein